VVRKDGGGLMKPVRVRFAPSPTGSLHVGGARTALFNYLLAKSTGGKFVLRIEDTDQGRNVHGAEGEMKQDLLWLGLQWDEFYRQSERGDIHEARVIELLGSGAAYFCFCEDKLTSR